MTLNGTVQSVSDADNETVAGIFKAISTGSARSDVSLSEGTLTEIRQVAALGTSGVRPRGNLINHIGRPECGDKCGLGLPVEP